MLAGVVCKDDGVHVIPEEFFKIFEEGDLYAVFLRGLSRFFKKGAVLVADSDDLRIGVLQEDVYHRASSACAEYAYSELFHDLIPFPFSLV